MLGSLKCQFVFHILTMSFFMISSSCKKYTNLNSCKRQARRSRVT
uniref:Uncharacterized protein n=1 Tax=Rhizophora mucronata TaxID=61149 RepID=A0A2P2Q2L9_RHIMU